MSDLVEIHDYFGVKPGYYGVDKVKGMIWSYHSKRYIGSTAKVSGYLNVKLALLRKEVDGKAVTGTLKIHRVVKISCDGLVPKGMVVDHINRNKVDNRLGNLRFATYSENAKNADPVRVKGSPVIQLTRDGEIIKRWNDAREAGETLKIDPQQIRGCCEGHEITYHGFRWMVDRADLEGEIWKPMVVNGYNIQVSNLGRVKLPRLVPKYGTVDSNGYASVSFNRSTYKVHRLVCVAFHGRSLESDLVVNHKDSDKLNNCADNIEWMTAVENSAYSCAKIVLQYENGIFKAEFPSAPVAGRLLNINSKQIRSCCNGGTKTAGGFEWKFKSPPVVQPKPSVCGKAVIRIGVSGQPDTMYDSISQAARDNYLQAANIGKCCRGERDKTGGFRWKFASAASASAASASAIEI